LDDDFQKSPTQPGDHSLQVTANNNDSFDLKLDHRSSRSNGTLSNNLAGPRSTLASQKRSNHESSSGPPPTKMQKMSQTAVARSLPTSSSSSSSSFPATNALPLATPANLFHPPSSSFHSSIPHPSESADLLYEYFPLSMDDWQVPVDAVYRPHVVHHTNMPSDSRFMAARGKSSRYFAAEDVC
jgi:hypothetical protein